MIRFDDPWFRWDEQDEVPMSKIVGTGASSKGYVNPLSSVLMAAHRMGVPMEEELKSYLGHERRLRKRLRKLLKRPRKRLERFLGSTYPSNLLTRLFDHQVDVLAKWEMAEDDYPHHLLADQPGVGKTQPSIMWMDSRLRPDVSKVLVLTPGSAREQWAREIRRWAPNTGHRISIVDGRIEEQIEILEDSRGWVVGHWECLQHGASEGVLNADWDGVILDEAHNIRNRDSVRSNNTEVMAKDIAYKLALTGHPYVNAPDEFFPILRFLYPHLYSSYWRFFSHHVSAVPKYFGGFDIKGVRNSKILRWEIEPFTMRREKRDVFDLPEISRIRREVELTKKGRKEYDRLKKDFFVKLESDLREGGEKILAVPSILARTTRMRQYLVNPLLLEASEKSPKWPVMFELVDELDGPLVIFSMFRQALELISRDFKKYKLKVGHIWGGQKDRGKQQERFLNGDFDVFLVVVQAGGTALNLGKYGYLAFLDLPWTSMDLEQCEGRVDRPEEGTGTMVPSTSWRIITKGTYEEKLEKKIEKKNAMFQETFSLGEVKELFRD